MHTYDEYVPHTTPTLNRYILLCVVDVRRKRESAVEDGAYCMQCASILGHGHGVHEPCYIPRSTIARFPCTLATLLAWHEPLSPLSLGPMARYEHGEPVEAQARAIQAMRSEWLGRRYTRSPACIFIASGPLGAVSRAFGMVKVPRNVETDARGAFVGTTQSAEKLCNAYSWQPKPNIPSAGRWGRLLLAFTRPSRSVTDP